MLAVRLLLLVASCSLVLSNLHAQFPLYVDAQKGQDGFDGNRGYVPERPWRTIQFAVNASKAGTVINVAPGVYTDTTENDPSFDVFINKRGEPDNYITIRGQTDEEGNRPVIASAGVNAFFLCGAAYIKIENLELRPAAGDPKDLLAPEGDGVVRDNDYRGRAGISIVPNNGCTQPGELTHHIIVQNCYVHDYPAGGLQAGGSDYVWFDNNVVEHCGRAAANQTSGISMFEMKDLPSDVPGAGDEFPDYPGYGLVISNNVSRYNVNLQGAISDGNGIIIDQLLDVVPTQPLQGFADRAGSGESYSAEDHIADILSVADEPYTKRSLIIGNEAYGNGGLGINVFTSRFVDVYYNVTYDNGLHQRLEHPCPDKTVVSPPTEYQVGGSYDVNVVNNVFFGTDEDFPFTNIRTFWNVEARVKRTNNVEWNSSGGVTSDESVDDRFIDDPGYGLTPLTRAQIELLARGSCPDPSEPASYDSTTASAQLREPTVTQDFPVHDFTVPEGSPIIDLGVKVADFRDFLGEAPEPGPYEFDDGEQGLPVDYSQPLAARQVSGGVALTWSTAAEIDCRAFFLESTATPQVEDSWSVFEQQSCRGNGSAYTVPDTRPLSTTRYYRLRQVDLDGTEELSPIVSVSGDQDLSAPVVLVGVDQWTLSGFPRDADLVVLDIAGRPVFTVDAEQRTVATAGLADGIYLIRYEGEGGSGVLKVLR